MHALKPGRESANKRAHMSSSFENPFSVRKGNTFAINLFIYIYIVMSPAKHFDVMPLWEQALDLLPPVLHGKSGGAMKMRIAAPLDVAVGVERSCNNAVDRSIVQRVSCVRICFCVHRLQS